MNLDAEFKIWTEPRSYGDESFWVNGIGLRERMTADMIDRPDGTGDVMLMYFHDPVTIRVDDRPLDLDAGALTIWDRTDGHVYGSDEHLWMHSWIHADGAFIDECIREARLPYRRPLYVGASRFEAFIAAIRNEMIHPAGHHPIVLKNLFQTTMIEFSRSIRRPERSPDQIIQAIKTYLESHFTERITLRSLADRFFMSQPHLSAEFRRVFGTSPIDYVLRLRMNHACLLMKNQNLRLANIAEQVGYDDPAYFSRLFKKRLGISPRRYRRSRPQ